MRNKSKKYFFLLLAGLIIGFLPQTSWAANESCECTATVVGKGCNLKVTKNLAYGVTIYFDDILDGANIKSCKGLNPPGVITGKAFIMQKSDCDQSLSVPYGDYTFGLSCKSSNKAPNLGTSPSAGAGGSQSGAGASAGLGGGNKYDKDIIKLQNPIGSDEVTIIVGKVIFAAMGIMGSLALVVFVYGGFRWLTAAGNSESVTAGTQAMVWAAIGIFIIFASYAILQLVFKGIGALPE